MPNDHILIVDIVIAAYNSVYKNITLNIKGLKLLK